jgi:predicted RNase H-like HicB family nuclease
MEATYTVVLEREEDGRYSVSVPALPGCLTWGENLPHALHMVEEAIELYLEVLEEDGEPFPPDTPEVKVSTAATPEVLVYRLTVGESVGVV